MSADEVGLAPALSSERLILRHWRRSDRAPFASLNADPEVMRHFPATLTRAESDAMIDDFQARLAEHGYGLWALESVADGRFIGFTGLNHVSPALPFAPAVEVGWRLARSAWGHGYASEAARTSLAVAFDDLALAEVVSFTTVANERSRAVMRRLGMTHDPAEDFEHPRIPAGSPVRPHVLYRLRARDWRSGSYPATAAEASQPQPASESASRAGAP